MGYYKVRARLAIMDKQFKEAESIYLEQVIYNNNMGGLL